MESKETIVYMRCKTCKKVIKVDEPDSLVVHMFSHHIYDFFEEVSKTDANHP